nr:MICOS complex subunit Mic10-like [Ipomoea batatas]
MAEENKKQEFISPPAYDFDAKWDACLDLALRRGVYFSFIGVLGGLICLRSPVTRRSVVAFGAGAALGSAYSECSYKFAKYGPHVPDASKTAGVCPIGAGKEKTKTPRIGRKDNFDGTDLKGCRLGSRGLLGRG